MPEWLKGPAWKAGIWETVSRVRIPLSPLKSLKTSAKRWFFCAHMRTKLASVSNMGTKKTVRRRRTVFEDLKQGTSPRDHANPFRVSVILSSDLAKRQACFSEQYGHKKNNDPSRVFNVRLSRLNTVIGSYYVYI